MRAIRWRVGLGECGPWDVGSPGPPFILNTEIPCQALESFQELLADHGRKSRSHFPPVSLGTLPRGWRLRALSRGKGGRVQSHTAELGTVTSASEEFNQMIWKGLVESQPRVDLFKNNTGFGPQTFSLPETRPSSRRWVSVSGDPCHTHWDRPWRMEGCCGHCYLCATLLACHGPQLGPRCPAGRGAMGRAESVCPPQQRLSLAKPCPRLRVTGTYDGLAALPLKPAPSLYLWSPPTGPHPSLFLSCPQSALDWPFLVLTWTSALT